MGRVPGKLKVTPPSESYTEVGTSGSYTTYLEAVNLYSSLPPPHALHAWADSDCFNLHLGMTAKCPELTKWFITKGGADDCEDPQVCGVDDFIKDRLLSIAYLAIFHFRRRHAYHPAAGGSSPD
ncbi:uncharacterized protein CLUP02_14457 [Colletotrichum lupini]|uniref:Uncharacterized protein n=1 Tax=Colletotrichum lupini TaxID=145971 RepID=A0A9Q8T511_9PEZI|nr:uncharacterized protein CLUP02_14457 [Colletotrichum lupini]UQC88930.1 hypothetical protein CLUP02_14457 [Colletotrichum lupini]